MRYTNRLLLIFNFFLMPKLSISVPISGGILIPNSNSSKYSFMVSFLQIKLGGVNIKYQHFCGGSLLNSKWALTAAHCFWNKDPAEIVAVMHGNHIPHRIKLVAYFTYQPSNYQNDIALVKIDPPRVMESYAKLPIFGIKANKRKYCTILGYGAQSDDATFAESDLFQGHVFIITRKKCQRILGGIWVPQRGDSTVCALGQQNTCQGDSGGPLMCQSGEEEVIYGITSLGVPCGITEMAKNIPGLYTIIIPFLDWINFIIAK